jgi:hypothetical protein
MKKAEEEELHAKVTILEREVKTLKQQVSLALAALWQTEVTSHSMARLEPVYFPLEEEENAD